MNGILNKLRNMINPGYKTNSNPYKNRESYSGKKKNRFINREKLPAFDLPKDKNGKTFLSRRYKE